MVSFHLNDMNYKRLHLTLIVSNGNEADVPAIPE